MPQLDALFENAAKGDETAFSTLVKLTEGTVFRYVYHLVHDREDAMDISQETYIKLWRSLPSYRGDCSPTTYLLRIANSCALDFLRAAKHKKTLPLSVSGEPGEELALDVPDPDVASNPVAFCERKQVREAVRRALTRLSDEHREVIALCDFDGRSYEEIAEILDIAPGTVKSRLWRARAALRKILTDGNFF